MREQQVGGLGLGVDPARADQRNKALTAEFHTSGSHYELTYKVV